MFIENAQEINWWLEIAKIAVPSLITLGIGLWLSRKTESYKTILSKEIEDYKKDISKELESHKIQLQSEFQTKFYEFQTRFSILQQKRAEVFAEIISKLFLLGRDLASMDYKKSEITKIRNDYDTFESYYFKHRLYISNELKEKIDSLSPEFHKIIVDVHRYLINEKDEKKLEDENSPFRKETFSKLMQIAILVEELEIRFMLTLFPEINEN